MNRSILLFSILLTSTVFAQNSERIEKLIAQKRNQINKIDQLDSPTLTYVPSIFAKEFVEQNKGDLNELTITKVYYVYTQYRLSPTFDQLGLDRDRFQKLDRIITDIAINPLIEWEILEQTGCKDYTEGKDYFHGFILVHRPKMTEEERMDEVNAITNFFDNPTENFIERDLDLVAKQINDSICTCEFEKLKEKSKEESIDLRAEFQGGDYELYEHFRKTLINSEEVSLKRDDIWVDIKFKVDEAGRVSDLSFMQNYPSYIQEEIKMSVIQMPDWLPSVSSGETVSSTVNLQVRVSYSGSVKGMYTRDYLKPTFNSDDVPITSIPEESGINMMVDQEAIVLRATAVYRGLDQLKEGEKLALVMDVTGSMSSNIAAMKKWIATNQERDPFTSFTFFNDGDNAPSKKKKIGATGGIYHTKELAGVKEAIRTAMMNGGGGERPENDVEAILYALENDPDCDAIVLIGDNYSEVRDLALLNKVSKPVYVVPCAAPTTIRHDYLNIARRTGGYLIHKGKVVQLDHVQKGERLFVNGAEYKFDGRDFKVKNPL